MRFGYWLPVFGGWLRNVDDEGMEASWRYVSRLARRSEELGFDLTLIAELSFSTKVQLASWRPGHVRLAVAAIRPGQSSASLIVG